MFKVQSGGQIPIAKVSPEDRELAWRRNQYPNQLKAFKWGSLTCLFTPLNLKELKTFQFKMNLPWLGLFLFRKYRQIS